MYVFSSRKSLYLVITLICITFSVTNPLIAKNDEWDWPLQPKPHIITAFDKPSKKWLPGHRGLDLQGYKNQPVYAAGRGTVIYIGKIAGTAIISIQHRNNLRTTYQPVKPLVKVGQLVTKGTIIGKLLTGHASCFPLICLHWGLLRGRALEANYLNPLLLIYGAHVILKPL